MRSIPFAAALALAVLATALYLMPVTPAHAAAGAHGKTTSASSSSAGSTTWSALIAAVRRPR